MAKNDNLKDFLIDVANAIREKKGTTEKINPQDFSSEIIGIESGGGDDINFSFTVADSTIISTDNYTSFTIKEGVKKVAIYGGDFFNVTNVTIPSSVEIVDKSCFQNFSKLTAIELPEKLTTIDQNAFFECATLSSIIIPKNVTKIQAPCFGNCRSLNEIVVDANNTKYDSRDNCNAIIETATNTLIEGGIASTIPNGITTIDLYAFRGRGPERLVFPKSITRIETNAFNGNKQTLVYDFSNHEVVPTLANVNAFASTSTTYAIVVPDALYDQWIVATNWSTYASRIVKASEYVEPTNE